MAETYSKSPDGKRLVVKAKVGAYTIEQIKTMIRQLTDRRQEIEKQLAIWEKRLEEAKNKGIEGA